MWRHQQPPRRGFAAKFPAFLVVAGAIAVAGFAVRAADTTNAHQADEAAIRANVAAFNKAYNAGDAAAIANLFAPDAQIIDEDDKTTQGRAAIEQAFAASFAQSPQSHIEVEVSSLRFIGSALAVETGTTKTVLKPGDAPDITHYTVVHTKSLDGNWLTAFARDTPLAEVKQTSASDAAPARDTTTPASSGDTLPTNFERLKPLAWLIGDWIDEGDDSIVVLSSKWSADKNFILQKIEVRSQGKDSLTLSQRIGWDPIAGRIKSWVFDSDGGFGESTWEQKGNRWVLKATGVRRDGTRSSATNIITPSGKDAYTWRSTDRVVGTEELPPTEVKIVRKPPEPAK